jgi:putative DNA methylase
MVVNGDSSNLPLPDDVVDFVITDPPYFDYVHYSELSDFFFAWLSPVLRDRYEYFSRESSYADGEVQHKNADDFSRRLASVFSECKRVLKTDGLLMFSFHHSKVKGWSAIYRSLLTAGFVTVATFPVHGELKVASPKSQTDDPISLDMLLICRVRERQSKLIPPIDVNRHLMLMLSELEIVEMDISNSDKFNMYAALALLSNSQMGKSQQEFEKDLTTYFAG